MNELMTFDKPAAWYVAEIVRSVTEGEANPLDVQIATVKMGKILKGIRDSVDVRDALIREFERYGTRKVSYKGAEFRKTDAGVRYDYSACGDSVMDGLLKQRDELETRIRERAEFLKRIPGSGTADPETGGMIYPPARLAKETIKTILK